MPSGWATCRSRYAWTTSSSATRARAATTTLDAHLAGEPLGEAALSGASPSSRRMRYDAAGAGARILRGRLARRGVDRRVADRASTRDDHADVRGDREPVGLRPWRPSGVGSRR